MNRLEYTSNSLELESLADYLLDKKDAVLEEWKDSVENKTGEQSSTLVSFSRSKFFNSIPSLLECICKGLRNGEISVEEIARDHGKQRWNHGLDLRELIGEWSLLHLVMMDQINQARESVSLDAVSLAEAQRKLAQNIYSGIRASADEYYELQRRKAEGRMRDLETVVQEQGGQTVQRGENVQEASHDLKGSMTALRMNLFLLEKTDLSDRSRQLVERLSLSTDSLTQMINNLLDLSRLEAGRERLEVHEFDAAKSLRSLCESLQPVAEAESLELRIRGEDSLQVRGDRLKVQRIAQNLLMNSLKYTQEGYVEVSWETVSSDQWRLIVRDTGPGMNSMNAASLTDSSSRAETTVQTSVSSENYGSEKLQMHSEGIGLSIVRQLCKLLDGILEIESEPDTGTTVRIVFPMDYPGE